MSEHQLEKNEVMNGFKPFKNIMPYFYMKTVTVFITILVHLNTRDKGLISNYAFD